MLYNYTIYLTKLEYYCATGIFHHMLMAFISELNVVFTFFPIHRYIHIVARCQTSSVGEARKKKKQTKQTMLAVQHI